MNMSIMWKVYAFVTLFGTICCYNVPKEKTAPLITLNDGNSMPAFALATWAGPDEKEGLQYPVGDSMQKVIEEAIDVGYRHFDTAQIYGTLRQVGYAVNKKIKENVVTREEIFITTKLWNDKHALNDVVPSLRESLAELNLDYVDLFLIYWPISTYENMTVSDIDYRETWQGMIEAKRLGLAKSIGVSHFNIDQLETLLKSTDVVPAVLQTEVNLNIQESELSQFCRDHNIVLIGAFPFGSMFSAKADSPAPKVSDPQCVAIAEKYKKSVPQIVLRYMFELVVVPVPHSTKTDCLVENIDIFDFELTQEDRKVLKSFDNGFRSIVLNMWQDSKFYPF